MPSTRTRRTAVLSVLLATTALSSTGCLAVAAGAAGTAAVGYVYAKGKVGRHYAADCEDVWAATHSALAELGLPVLSEERDTATSGNMVSRTGDGDKVRIDLETEPSRLPGDGPQTAVTIRVATFGDQAISERILDQVSFHLVPGGAVQPLAPQPVRSAAPFQTAPPPLLPPDPAKP